MLISKKLGCVIQYINMQLHIIQKHSFKVEALISLHGFMVNTCILQSNLIKIRPQTSRFTRMAKPIDMSRSWPEKEFD